MASIRLQPKHRAVDASSDQGTIMNLFGDNLPDVVGVYSFNLSRVNPKSDPALLETLRVLYQVLTNEVNIQVRESFLKGVIHEIRSSQLDAACLLPVVMSENDPEIIDLAVVNYLELCKVTASNQFLALENLAVLLSNPKTINRGAVHASIACFGDRRACSVLKSLQCELADVELSGFYDSIRAPRKMKLATLDYLLSWILSLEDTNRSQLIETLAAGLSAYLLNTTESGKVFDSSYNFGPNCFPNYTPEACYPYSQVLAETGAVLERLKASQWAPLKGLAAILENPALMTLEAMEADQDRQRRERDDRRASDRRIVTLMPLIERRASQRRNLERRSGNG